MLLLVLFFSCNNNNNNNNDDDDDDDDKNNNHNQNQKSNSNFKKVRKRIQTERLVRKKFQRSLVHYKKVAFRHLNTQGIFNNNYIPKWRWLKVDIYRAAKLLLILKLSTI